MRMIKRDKMPIKYATYIGAMPIYQTDSDGNIQYDTDAGGNRYPIETGETEDIYGNVSEMSASISRGGGEAEAVAYGLSVSDYEAVLVAEINAYPLKEGDYIWTKSPVKYLYDGEEKEFILKNGEAVTTKAVEVESADYQVLQKPDSLNVAKWILKAVNK